MLEYIDKTFFKFLATFAPPNQIKVLVTGDHSTPCRMKAHSADPVPVLFYNQSAPGLSFLKRIKIPGFFKRKEQSPEKKGAKFCEGEARNGTLGIIFGKDLLEKVGFNK